MSIYPSSQCRLLETSTAIPSYDTHGVFSSPRALFMFRAFGHDRSSILDGGLPAWQAHDGPVESGDPTAVQDVQYPVPTMDADVIRSMFFAIPHALIVLRYCVQVMSRLLRILRSALKRSRLQNSCWTRDLTAG